MIWFSPLYRRLFLGLLATVGSIFPISEVSRDAMMWPAAAAAAPAPVTDVLESLTPRRVGLPSRGESQPDSRRLVEMGTTVALETGLPVRIAVSLVLEASRYHLRLPVVLGLIAQESSFYLDVVHHNANGTHDTGLMQLNSGTYPWLGRKVGLADPDPSDPFQNIQMGIWYLAYLRDDCGGNLTCALSRYNGDRTNAYAMQVLERSDRFARLLGTQ